MSKIQVQHFHDAVTGRLVLTVATELLADSMIKIAGAVVSPKDQPIRELGARIAIGRLNSVRENTNVYILQHDLVREMIRNRTIGALFPTNFAFPTLRGPKPDKKSKKRTAL